MQNFKIKRKGFTLVELVVVILIIAILATATFLGGATIIKQSRISKVQGNLRNYATYVQDMFYAEPGVVNKTESDAKELLNGKYLTKDFQLGETKDAWNKPYEFYFATNTVDSHKYTYVVISSDGPNGTKESYEAVYTLSTEDHVSVQAALDSVALTTGDDLGLIVLLRDGAVSSANYGFEKASAAPTAITMLDGEEQIYNGTTPLVFRSSANVHTFQEVKVDSETVAPANYTVTEGPTIITFADTYAKSLTDGAHTVEIVSEGGTATISFTIQLTCTVTFDANGGPVTPTSRRITYGDMYGELPILTRDGYVFNGWYTAAIDGDEVKSSTTVTITAAQTLYAHWTAGSYTVTFNANGGTVATTSKPVTYNNEYGELPVPTYTGYVFDGWYKTVDGSDKIESSTVMTTNDNHTLYAHWTEAGTVATKNGTQITSSFATLKTISAEIAKETSLQKAQITAKHGIAIGDYIMVDGLTCYVADFNHDSANGETGITLVANTNQSHAMNGTNTNAGGWTTSVMRTWLNDTVLSTLTTINANAKTVTKKSDGGYADKTIKETQGKIWPLSFEEVFPSDYTEYKSTMNYVVAGQGTIYPIFTADNSSRTQISSSGWWLRSTNINSSISFRYVDVSGGSYSSGANRLFKAVVGFCI